MIEFPLVPVLFLAIFHCIMGGLATVVAVRKGRSLNLWLLFGLIGGTVALVAAIALKPLETP
jgi:hypothetical protein